ncbi:hypothetical protein NYE33_33655 [Paenibacillus sp. FSL R10-2199]|uniref:hypothetical protein n=1 Tax=Paenibacillus sp. FSL R10-2199 TaxID=2975348 RepID=UPI0030FCCD86
MEEIFNYLKRVIPNIQQQNLRNEDCKSILDFLGFISTDEIRVESAQINVAYIKIWNMFLNMFWDRIEKGEYSQETLYEVLANVRAHFFHLLESPGFQGDINVVRKNIAAKGYSEVHLDENMTSKLISTSTVMLAAFTIGTRSGEQGGQLDLFLTENFYKKYREVRKFIL